jgi:hypothetical protein
LSNTAGCVILSDGFTEANLDAWWDRLKEKRVAIEHVLNHLHVFDLIPSDTSERDPSVYQFLGAAIVEMWASRVRELFPNRRFVVRLEDTDDGANATCGSLAASLRNRTRHRIPGSSIGPFRSAVRSNPRL